MRASTSIASAVESATVKAPRRSNIPRPARVTRLRQARLSTERGESSSAPPVQIRRVTKREFQDMTPSERPLNVLLYGVPKTSLRVDILRALRDVKAVNDDFPLSNITCSTDVELDQTSLQRVVHIHAGDPTAVENLFNTLTKTSPFTPWRQPSRNAEYTFTSPSDWRTSRIQANTFIDTSPNPLRRRNDHAVEYFAPDWLKTAGKEGRRVILTGLAYGVDFKTVREIVHSKVFDLLNQEAKLEDGSFITNGAYTSRDTGLLNGTDGVVRLPRIKGMVGGTFGLTFRTVEHAAYAARKVNMSLHQPPASRSTGMQGPQNVLRTEVLW